MSLLRGPSLRLNLMIWLAGPVALVLAASVWVSWQTATNQAQLIMERNLTASARMIAEEVRYRDGAIGVIVPPAAFELFATGARDEVAYAVTNPAGVLIAGFPGLAPPTLAPGTNLTPFDTTFRTEVMHAVTLRQPVITPDGTQVALVTVGETLGARTALQRSLWLRGFAEQAALVLAAAISIWIGISIELLPLLQLRRAVLGRGPRSLEPFDETAVQQELRPLVQALNAHMARLGAYLERQKRFLDGAAHQMRTSLAVLKTEVGLARRGAGDAAATLAHIDEGLSRITRVANQLLTLGRVEHERARMVNETVDLCVIVREVVAGIAPRALDRGVDLVLEAPVPCRVEANPLLLREVVLNLVDNAIVHGGAGCVATVGASVEDGRGIISVSDTGPGVAPADRALLLRPFGGGRRRGEGAGLGLSIVAEIASLFGGQVELPEPSGGGFCVRVVLPLSVAAAQGTAEAKALV